MEAELIAKIAECIIELGNLIRDDDEESGELYEFRTRYVSDDVVSVNAKMLLDNGDLQTFKYAMYIDVETLHVEADGA